MEKLLKLLERLRVRQSWCPYCSGEYCHREGRECVLLGLWFPSETEKTPPTDFEDLPDGR